MLFDSLKSSYVNDSTSNDLLNQLKTSLNDYLESFEKAKIYIKMGYPISEDNRIHLVEYEETALELLDQYVNLNIKQAGDLIGNSKGIYINKIINFIVLAFIACALILVVLVYLMSTVRKSIKQVFNVLARITGGSGSLSLTNISDNEFDKIKNALSKTIIRQEDIEQLEELNFELSNALEEVKNAQEKLIQKERLVTLGQLVGGIAHNLKTPIIAIAGNAMAIKNLAIEYDNAIEYDEITISDHQLISNEMITWIDKIKPMLDYMDKVIKSVMRQSVVLSNNPMSEKFGMPDLIESITILMNYEVRVSSCNLIIENSTSPNTHITGQISALVQVLKAHSQCGRLGEI